MLRGANAQEPRPDATAAVEELYVARSVRESRIKPTEFCANARTSFENSIYEDRYTFRSTAGRTSDGRVIETNVKTIGDGHACFGQTGDPKLLSFYAEIVLGTPNFRGLAHAG